MGPVEQISAAVQKIDEHLAAAERRAGVAAAGGRQVGHVAAYLHALETSQARWKGRALQAEDRLELALGAFEKALRRCERLLRRSR